MNLSKVAGIVCLSGLYISTALAAFPGENVTMKGVVTGDLKGHNKIYVNYSWQGKMLQDSITVTNGRFEKSVPFDAAEWGTTLLLESEYCKVTGKPNADRVILPIDAPGTLMITWNRPDEGLNRADFSGMPSTALHKEFVTLLHNRVPDVKEQMAAAAKAFKATNDSKMYRSTMAALLDAYRDMPAMESTKAFVRQHPNTFSGLFYLNMYKANYTYDPVNLSRIDTLEAMLSYFPQDRIRTTKLGAEVTGYITHARKGIVGDKLKDFTLSTPDGKHISFSQLKGKYVLLDFWASWCKPCMASFPPLKKAYEDYKVKGVILFSISIDKSREAWLAGLEKHHLPWMQGLDDMQEATKQFAVNSVPTMMLISPDGRILLQESGFSPDVEEKIASFLK